MRIETIIKGDTPTESNRTISTEELMNAINVFNSKEHKVGEVIDYTFVIDPNINLAKVAYNIETCFLDESGVLCAYVKPLKTPAGDMIFNDNILPKIKFTPRYYGIVSEDGIVTDVELISVDAVLEP